MSMASHELRTPLTPLLLQLQRLQPEAEGHLREAVHPKIAKIAQRAESQVRRLVHMVDDLLDVAQMAKGELDLRLEPVDLGAVVRAVVGRLEERVAGSPASIELNLAGWVVGWWDPARLEQVVGHLMSNALKYGAGSPIEIEAHGGDDRIWLTVRDHGIGIALADQQRIFQRFERAASERHYGGLGLGLWIASELTKGLGGEIAVESAPGAGASFTVTLPRRAAAGRHTPPARVSSPPPHAQR